MLHFIMWYFIIGLGIATLLMSVFVVIRQQIPNPFQGSECVWRALGWTLAWPAVLLNLITDRTIVHLFKKSPAPFRMPEFNNETEPSAEDIEAFWLSLPPCGKYVSVKGLNDSAPTFTPSTFIFKSAELVCSLEKSIWKDIREFVDGDETVGLKHWLREHDVNLEFISQVPQKENLGHSLVEIVKQGIGECYCMICNKTYSARQLTVPESTWDKSSINESLLCPKEHLLHYISSHIFIKKSDAPL